MRKLAFWLSLALITVIPLENAVVVEGLGRLSKLVGVVAGIIWVVKVLAAGGLRRPRPVHLVILAFICWNAMSVIWSVAVDDSGTRALTYIQILGLVLIVWDLYETPAALRAGLQAYVLGAWVPIVSSIHNYLTARHTFYYNRYSASGFHVDDLGQIVALGVPISWYLALRSGDGPRSRWWAVINWIYTPAAVLVIFLTASRSSILALAPSCVFALLLLNKIRPQVRIAVAAVSVAAVLAIFPFVPASSLKRFAGTTEVVTSGDLNGRTEIWRQGLDIFSEHPWIGVGTGAFRSADVDYGKAGHNLVISLLAEIGLVGFTLFSAAFLLVLRDALAQPKDWRRLWITVLMIWGLGALTHNWEARKQTWLILTLVTVGAATKEEFREPRDSAAPAGSRGGPDGSGP